MKIKEGVIMSDKPVMRRLLITADRIWKKHKQILVVTSGMEGTHSAGSYHYYGYAYDFRTRYFDEETKTKVAKELQEALDKYVPKLYKVVKEPTHIHVQWERFPT